MQYYGNRLSENISRREPEGYLLCLNVPVARTGSQDYLPEELGLPPSGGPIPVFRPEEEVFSPETMASFEGMPVTNDHPPDGVDVDNIRRLQMGHAHNVRRGSGEESDLLLADLIITDERLIDAILSGKREISCGYTYELSEENGQYIQRKIRGNHIAVVDAGRAGHRVSIKDHKQPVERRPSVMKKSLSKLLARMAKDGDIETVAEFIEEMIGEEPEAPAEAVAEGEASTTAGGGKFVEAEVIRNEQAPQCGAATIENAGVAEPTEAEKPEVTVTVDEDTLSGIIERLDKLIALLTPSAPAGDEDPDSAAEEIAEIVEEAIEAVEAEEDPGEPVPEGAVEEIAEIVESVLAPEISTTLEEPGDDCGDPEPVAKDALIATLLAVRPALKGQTEKQRMKTCKDIAARLYRRKRKASSVDALSQKKRSADGSCGTELGKQIMAARNPHYHQ